MYLGAKESIHSDIPKNISLKARGKIPLFSSSAKYKVCSMILFLIYHKRIYPLFR